MRYERRPLHAAHPTRHHHMLFADRNAPRAKPAGGPLDGLRRANRAAQSRPDVVGEILKRVVRLGGGKLALDERVCHRLRESRHSKQRDNETTRQRLQWYFFGSFWNSSLHFCEQK